MRELRLRYVHVQVARALRLGMLVRQPCEQCGDAPAHYVEGETEGQAA